MSKEEVFKYLDYLSRVHPYVYGYGFPQTVKEKFGTSYKDALDFVAEWMKIKEEQNAEI